jgi:hypothetical protein
MATSPRFHNVALVSRWLVKLVLGLSESNEDGVDAAGGDGGRGLGLATTGGGSEPKTSLSVGGDSAAHWSPKSGPLLCEHQAGEVFRTSAGPLG